MKVFYIEQYKFQIILFFIKENLTLIFLLGAIACGGIREESSHNGLVRAEYVGCSMALRTVSNNSC